MVRIFVTLPINLCFNGTTMPAVDHIREAPSEMDTNRHATEPANNDTTIKSSDLMPHQVVKKNKFDQLFCFNAGCLLTVCIIGMVRALAILLVNLCFKRTIMSDFIRVVPSEMDKNTHSVLYTTYRSELVSGFIVNSKTASINTSQLLTLKGSIPVMTGDNMEVPKLHVVENTSKVNHDCYLKPSYPVLVGNAVRTYNTKLYASLPQQNKYMVKQRVRDASGAAKIKLVLLQSSNER